MSPSKSTDRPSSAASRSAAGASTDCTRVSTPSGSLFPDVEIPVEFTITPLAEQRRTGPSVREPIELVPAVDCTLRSIATAIGITPRDVLGHLLAYVTQRVREHRAAGVSGDLLPSPNESPAPGQTVVLRGIRISKTGRALLRRWARTSGRSVSALVTERILQVDARLSARTDEATEHPLDAYQRLLDVLHQRNPE